MYEVPKVVKFVETESRMVVTAAARKRNTEPVFSG